MTAVDETTRAQIDRIIQSEALRSSNGLRRLLKFLADKSLSGEADQLKEYTIGIDAFGKPSTYDPRQDSTVRIQVGRLRQKLTEYYQSEGKDDPIVVDLPKGRFKLNWQPRAALEFPVPALPQEIPVPVPRPQRSLVWVIVFLIVVSGWAVYSTVQLREERHESEIFRAQWTPEIEMLWRPFLATERPLLVSISAPLFVDFGGAGMFRDLTVNRPEDVPRSPTIAAVGKVLKVQNPQPFIYYSTLGDVNVSFSLGRLLASRKSNVSIVNANELSWRQVSENNAVFIGSPKFFNQQLASMPVKTELFLEPRFGIRNLHPRDQEPKTFVDEYPQSRSAGTVFALVSHTPGPEGKGDIMSFACRNGAGIMGAVAWFTESAAARTLVGKLKKASGEIPRYYQVLLRVRFQDGVPLETSYVLHRELRSIENK